MTEFPSLAENLMTGNLDGKTAVALARPIGASAPNLYFIPAFYPFETAEYQLMFQWFLGDHEKDIRYHLASALLSDEVRSEYARIIIDGPPRMSTGLVNALCTSTHLFIPTVLDNLSAETVGSSALKIRRLRGQIMPRLKIGGVIGTMVPSKNLSQDSRLAAEKAEKHVRDAFGMGNYFFWEAFLQRSTNITNTTDAGIAYLKDKGTRALFDPIAEEVARRT